MQSRAQPRSAGRASAATRLSASGAAVAKAAATRKARASSESSSDGPNISIIKKPSAKTKKANQVWRWHLGYIYAGFGILDVLARLMGLVLWRARYDSNGWPRVSDTQREDIWTGNPTENTDFMRLVITGSNSIVRCAANFIILWHAFASLRPAWGLRLMRWITPLFRTLLVLWVFADLMQAFIPNTPPDPAEHRITTVHIFFAQMAWYACAPTYFIILVVMFFDVDAGKPSLVAGMFTSVLMTFSFIYYTTYLFRGITGKSTPMGWALVIEVAFLTFNVGMAMPRRIIAMPSDLGRKWYHPRFLRDGKVRVYEDTSARTGSKPLIFTNAEQADVVLNEDEDAFLRRQQEETQALNDQFKSLFGSAFDSWDTDVDPAKVEAKAAGNVADAEAGGAGASAEADDEPVPGVPDF